TATENLHRGMLGSLIADAAPLTNLLAPHTAIDELKPTPAIHGEAPRLDPSPASAEEEAIALLRIAAEVEGALMAQYQLAAGSLLQGISCDVPGFDPPIQSDDWYDLICSIAKQEMGHLITVQNLLLSLNAVPHVDRENFPLTSPLY